MIDVVPKTFEQLVREDVERQALEAAARKVEALSGNDLYQRAWRKAAQVIRSEKP